MLEAFAKSGKPRRRSDATRIFVGTTKTWPPCCAPNVPALLMGDDVLNDELDLPDWMEGRNAQVRSRR